MIRNTWNLASGLANEEESVGRVEMMRTSAEKENIILESEKRNLRHDLSDMCLQTFRGEVAVVS